MIAKWCMQSRRVYRVCKSTISVVKLPKAPNIFVAREKGLGYLEKNTLLNV